MAKQAETATPSNEAILKAMNALCDARNSLGKAKLSTNEQKAINLHLTALMCNMERLFVERLRHDFPAEDTEGVTLPDVFTPDEVIAEMHFDYDV